MIVKLQKIKKTKFIFNSIVAYNLIINNKTITKEREQYRCSSCNIYFLIESIAYYNYCPNCGKKIKRSSWNKGF